MIESVMSKEDKLENKLDKYNNSKYGLVVSGRIGPDAYVQFVEEAKELGMTMSRYVGYLLHKGRGTSDLEISLKKEIESQKDREKFIVSELISRIAKNDESAKFIAKVYKEIKDEYESK